MGTTMMNSAADLASLDYLATLAAHAVLWSSPSDCFETVDAIESTFRLGIEGTGIAYRAFEQATTRALAIVDDMTNWG